VWDYYLESWGMDGFGLFEAPMDVRSNLLGVPFADASGNQGFEIHTNKLPQVHHASCFQLSYSANPHHRIARRRSRTSDVLDYRTKGGTILEPFK
jgi:hypothetical protein